MLAGPFRSAHDVGGRVSRVPKSPGRWAAWTAGLQMGQGIFIVCL